MTTRILRPVLLAAFGLLGTMAHADDDAEHDKGRRVALLPQYVQECGACHTAFAPAMLPASSWQRVMSSLDRHYGTDASLDTDLQKTLSTWLQANAGTRAKVREAPPEDRITRSPWFVREHREVAAASWKHPSIGSAANCSACHTQAAQGSYREREIRIPR